MKKAQLALAFFVCLALIINTPEANAQFTQIQNNSGYGQGQGYGGGYNQGYNQGYGGGYNQGYNQGYQNTQQNLPPLQGSVAVAPSGTSLSVTTTSGLSSKINNVGDPVTTRLSSDLYINGSLVLPAGSQIDGQITELIHAGRTGKNGILGVRFTQAVLPDGRRVPISARIATEDGSGLIRGGSGKGRAGKMFLRSAGGAAAGAALGTALAPAAGGRVGKGAVYGTAIGGGLGVLSNLVAKGKEAELPSGSQLRIVLDQPLSVQGGASQGNYQQNEQYGGNQNYGGGYNNYGGGYNNYGGGY